MKTIVNGHLLPLLDYFMVSSQHSWANLQSFYISDNAMVKYAKAWISLEVILLSLHITCWTVAKSSQCPCQADRINIMIQPSQTYNHGKVWYQWVQFLFQMYL